MAFVRVISSCYDYGRIISLGWDYDRIFPDRWKHKLSLNLVRLEFHYLQIWPNLLHTEFTIYFQVNRCLLVAWIMKALLLLEKFSHHMVLGEFDWFIRAFNCLKRKFLFFPEKLGKKGIKVPSQISLYIKISISLFIPATFHTVDKSWLSSPMRCWLARSTHRGVSRGEAEFPPHKSLTVAQCSNDY